jgi:hypothetical protein
VLKDEFSGFLRFYPCSEASSRVTAEALLGWMADYSCCPRYLVSDQGSHFTSETIQELNRMSGIEHHFIVAYSPWANSVERANRTLKRVLTTMISESGQDSSQWPWFLQIVQKAINAAPRERNKGLSPTQVMLGHKPAVPMDQIFLPMANENLKITPLAKSVYFEQLQRDLESMTEIAQGNKIRNMRHSQKQSKGILEKFIPGDYVLNAKVTNHPGDKLLLNWQGPFRVIKALNTHVYIIEHLITKQTKTVHIQRLRRYADNCLNVSERIKRHVLRENNAYHVKEINNVRYNSNQQKLELQVHWLGFDSKADYTWEPADTIVEDVPLIVKIYMRKTGKQNPFIKDLRELLERQRR